MSAGTTTFAGYSRMMRQAGTTMPRTIERGLRAAEAAVDAAVSARAPVRTGALRDSITTRVQGARLTVTVGVPYAAQQDARLHFVEAGIDASTPAVLREVSESIDAALRVP